MVLTPAERAKRYRERIKQDPEKLKEHKEKKSKRMKTYNKKIKDLTEEQKEEQRRKWREQKKNQSNRKKKETISQQNVGECSSSSILIEDAVPKSRRISDITVKTRYKKLMTVHKRTLKAIDQYKKSINRLRKSLIRQKQYSEKTMKELQTENDKLKARQEVMELTLKDVYKNAKRLEVKQNIKVAIQTQPKKLCNKYKAGILGLKYPIRMKQMINRCFNKEIQETLDLFFNRDDISRMTAGKRETRTKSKKKSQIRYLVDTLQNLYEVFKNEGGKISFSTFCKYRPYYVLSPSVQRRETCLCIKHSNMEFMFLALKRKGVITHKNGDDLLVATACDTKSYDCMYNKCVQCKTISIQNCKNIPMEEITWSKWVRINHNYQKDGKLLTTKKTVKQQIKGPINKLLTEIEKELPLFKTHYFNWKEQQRQYRNCITNLKEDEVVIICDFSENYQCKYGQEIQSTHFGASKSSITLHTGMIFSKNSSQSFASVSDDNCHEPHAIWAHLMPVLRHSRSMVPQRKIIHFFSDGPTSQYRQKKNFYLLSLFTAQLELSYSTWSFSEAGHGKSVADGIGGSLTRTLDKRVSYGEDITNANDAYNILQRSGTSVKCFFIPGDDIENFKRLVPGDLLAVPGTLQLHQITANQQNQIRYRQLSCFCGEMRGFCNCYNPKSHVFLRDLISDIPDTLEVESTVSGTVNNDEGLVIPIISCVDNEISEPNSLHPANFDILTEDCQQNIVSLNCELIQFCNAYSDNDYFKSDFFECNDTPIVSSTDKILDSPKLSSKSCLLQNQEILNIPFEVKLPVSQTSKSNEKCYELEYSLKRTRILPKEVEPKQILANKENKLRKISSRSFVCFICKKRKDFNLREMVKCMVCSNWVCLSCSGTTFFDYICITCLR